MTQSEQQREKQTMPWKSMSYKRDQKKEKKKEQSLWTCRK